jgi:hypothetical protein
VFRGENGLAGDIAECGVFFQGQVDERIYLGMKHDVY